MGMFGRFTEKSQKAILFAQKEAKEQRHSYIGSEHLLLGIIKEGTGGAASILSQVGIDYNKAKSTILEIVVPGSDDVVNVNYTPRTKRIFEMSFEVARELGHNYVGTEHLLLGILREASGVAVLALRKLGIDTVQLERSIVEAIKRYESDTTASGAQPKEESALEKYAINLNEKARNGKIDPVIGRSKEIERVVQVLSRRTKNNPVLIGEPGVGKTAIAEGLAQKIVEGNVPDIIKDKVIFTLDISGMIAGAKYRGDFEDRMKNVIKEIEESENSMLFIDELHVVIGAGAAEGAMDASNILKPMLTKGRMQIIGATTIDEYRKHIEKDSAFERRLLPIIIEEPGIEDSVKILEGLRDKYEAHHGVKITDHALRSAVELSHRYLNDRFLPDKAIDLIDEAASKKKIESFQSPKSLRYLEQDLKKLIKEKEEAVNGQNFEKAASIRDEERALRKELDEKYESWKKQKRKSTMIVDFEEIAQIVSDWSGVPVTKMDKEETERLINLEDLLNSKVIGQKVAVSAIAKSVKRARVGLKDPKKPIGSFIFVGPTGVGKTYLAKTLSRALFNDEEAMIRIDMSEYMEKHTVSRLVGSPPGYVGYDDGGQLTEAVRRKPYSVVLFDEIEKAHPDVFNILLQILDEGRLTDSKGRVVDFKNTVVIMTSNVGATLLKKQKTVGFATSEQDSMESYEKMKDIINSELKNTFRPEFLNRIDEVIVFRELKEEQIREIVKLMLEDLQNRMKSMEIHIKLTENVNKYVSKEGFDLLYGARPLERAIRKNIEDRLADEILLGNISKKEEITIDYVNGQLTFLKGNGDKNEKEDLLQV